MNPQDPLEAPAVVVWTVSELTARIKRSLERDFTAVCVVGEISQFKKAASGHVYLTLKDQGAVLGAAMWRNAASRLPFKLEEGLEVVARGSIEVYPPRGSYQLIITELNPCGVGALQLAFRQLVQKLEAEGLFRPEHKVALPRFPSRIAVVTSPTGAAVRDIIRVIRRRWPPAEILVLPTRVQGEGAAEEIAAQIRLLDRHRDRFDVAIVGRGGGSLEDLWAFNEELVARAIYECRLPIVSAVGHETDVSVSDLVADLRAATPTEAAEKVVPDASEVRVHLNHLARRVAGLLLAAVSRARARLEGLSARPALCHPETRLRERAQRLDEILESMRASMDHAMALRSEGLRAEAGKLEALSPLRVLERGYSITFGPDGRVLRSVDGLAGGQQITSRVMRGEIRSSVSDARVLDEPRAQEVNLADERIDDV